VSLWVFDWLVPLWICTHNMHIGCSPLLVLNTTVWYIYIYKIFTTTTIKRLKVSESLLASKTYLWMNYIKRRFTTTEMFTVNKSFPNPTHNNCGSWTNNYRVILWYSSSWDPHYVPLNNVYHLLIIFLWFSHWVKDYQPVLGNFMTMSIQWKLFTHIYIVRPIYNYIKLVSSNNK